jgi:hypothetical protein
MGEDSRLAGSGPVKAWLHASRQVHTGKQTLWMLPMTNSSAQPGSTWLQVTKQQKPQQHYARPHLPTCEPCALRLNEVDGVQQPQRAVGRHHIRQRAVQPSLAQVQLLKGGVLQGEVAAEAHGK